MNGRISYNQAIWAPLGLILTLAGPALAQQAPLGNLDAISPAGGVAGWALDPDAGSAPVTVHFYLDGPAGTGQLLGLVTANQPRPDVNVATGIPGDHGFTYALPASLKDGQAHSLYIYAIDSSGSGPNPKITGSPRSFTLTAPPGPLHPTAGGQFRLNEGLAKSFGHARPTLEAAFRNGITKLVGKHGKVEVLSASLTALDLSAPPGLDFTAGGTAREGLRVVLPRAPGWTVGLKARVKYRQKLLFFTWKPEVDVSATVTGLQLTQNLTLDTSDPERPRILTVAAPHLQYNLSIQTSSLIVRLFFKKLLERKLRAEVTKLLSGLTGFLKSLEGFPRDPALGVGAPSRPTVPAGNVLAAARAASVRVQARHLPFGQIMMPFMSNPTPGSGQVVKYTNQPDSALWTGFYLAAESLRATVQGDPEARVGARKALDGIELLLQVSGTRGLLSRVAIPEASPLADPIRPVKDNLFRATFQGTSYLALENISRDQYTGVVLGLAFAAEHLGGAEAARAKEYLGWVLDYLVQNDWNLGRVGAVPGHTSFNQTPLSQLAICLAGARFNPGRFLPEFTRLAPLTSTVWLSSFINSLQPHRDYYKFSLSHAVHLLAMRYDLDPTRFRDYSRSFRIVHRTIVHHRNAQFTAVAAAIDPAVYKTTAFEAEEQDLLNRTLLRSTRTLIPTLLSDPTIEKISYQGIPSAKGFFQGGGGTAPTETIAKFPLPVEKRPYTDFVWQRSPFILDGWHGPMLEQSGIDLMFPYWLARYTGLVQ